VEFWALQEMASEEAFDALLVALGADWNGNLATLHSGQRVAFVYDTRVVSQVGAAAHILESYDHAFASRPPLELDIDVALPDTTVRIRMITLHMKAFGDVESRDRREEAAGRLKNRLDFLYPPDLAIIVLGDFNDELTGSITVGRDSPYAEFVADGDNYLFLTLPLEQANTGTFCGSSASCLGGSTIDHILISNELIDEAGGQAAARYEAAITGIPGFVFNTSDHAPVWASFDFNGSTSAETLPDRLSDLQVYPVPAGDRIWIDGAGAEPGARWQFLDVSGRTVARGRLDRQRMTVSLEGLADGLYLLRVDDGSGGALSRPVIIAR